MNSKFYLKNEQNIIDKPDRLIDTVDRQTETIENQTSVIDKLRSELSEKNAIIKKLKEQLGMNSQNSSKPPGVV